MSAELTAEQRNEVIRRWAHDKWWRVSTKYSVKNEDGRIVPFRPRPVQATMANNMHSRNIVLKSRQHGATTLMNVWFVDECIFQANTGCAFIAHDLKVGKQKLQIMKDIFLRFCEDWPEFGDQISLVTDQKEELRFSNGSSIYTATTVRSDTIQLGHLSEFGKVAYINPVKAQEIIDGTLAALHKNSLLVIESTAMGSNTSFKKLCDGALESKSAGRKLNRLDFNWQFYAWWMDKKNQLEPDEAAEVVLPPWMQKYFRDCAERGIRLSHAQMAWYYQQRITGVNMLQEHPTTPEECWHVEIEGAFFARELADLRARERICDVPHNSALDVHTAWDLGVNDQTCIWFFQVRGGSIRIIDYHEDNGYGMGHYLELLKKWADKKNSKGYRYGRHFGPHDMMQRDKMGGETLQSLVAADGWNFEVVPKQHLYTSIEQSRKVLAQCWFDSGNCQTGIERLQGYRKKVNASTGEFMNMPLHDINSHGADAFRYMAGASDKVLTVKNFRPAARRQKPQPRRAYCV